MLQSEFWLNLEYLWLSEQIGATWLFPLFNSLHVIGITFMLGSLLMVDLRLCGLAARIYSLQMLTRDFLPWVWGAFVISVVTGLGLFITRASAHVLNIAFQWKMILMLLAGINMVLLHFMLRRYRNAQQAETLPVSVRVAGFASLLLWAGVMLSGRWVGHII
ncbi:DUF6644 family protein [Pseudohongiella spirulinae]|uniref:Membrane protein n=1 Tax=Pseudohongiella spirulinae TaxID=1249552 RepID=A0A0S2KD76_9GAMM|nr:DUF6644 family protein [Pseudohongiella spirulinae]ALO46264.1 Membrane protein [Pseudohongiella spirulinae]